MYGVEELVSEQFMFWCRIVHLVNKSTSPLLVTKVLFRVLRHFTHKASVTSVNAKANMHSADQLELFAMRENVNGLGLY